MHALKFGEGEVTEKLNPARDQEVEPEGPAVSGLETAIRNALDRSERSDKEVRTRIYQSARQALDAGLRKQGVSDQLVIMEQRKRLEDKIREIENEEVDRITAAPEPSSAADMSLDIRPDPLGPQAPTDRSQAPAPSVTPVASVDAPAAARREAEPAPQAELGGVTRGGASSDHAPAPALEGQVSQQPTTTGANLAAPYLSSRTKRRGRKSTEALDVPAERSAKPRRRRSFLSHLLTWLVTLAVVGVGCWLFYQSGMVQSVMNEAMEAADRANTAQPSGQGPSVLASRGGFSEDWASIFVAEQGAAFAASPQAQAEIATGSEGEALRIASATPDAAGDVSIDVPAEVLRELAGRSSTLAITIQSAVDEPAQLSVRCDFGALATCQRHRFTATQEKLDALFRVTFNSTGSAPNAGRLILNSGLSGADRPIFVYSVRALPGR